ncbi:hypothetical protein G9P44_001149 [Scheffersomyces stipitis]|nr:hypothetical protein G9P44_001149 [Scheffersomyces stipitis]
MKRNDRWSMKGQTPVVKTPTTRSQSRTMLGAIFYDGLVQLSLNMPEIQNKKRKRQDGCSDTPSCGTVTGHYKSFIKQVISVLKHPKYMNSYLIMDNAPIHKNESIHRIEKSKDISVYSFYHIRQN